MAYHAEVLLDSVNPAGQRLTTFVLRFPRFVLPEFNTHRMFSRNASSSRAIPTAKLMQQLVDDPVIPVEWGRNQSGMQAREVLDEAGAAAAHAGWLRARDTALEHAEQLRATGVHKQIVNRLLEPWMWASVIVSSTTYDNFFTLRCHPDAQPEIKRLADLMRVAYEASSPVRRATGEWHLPFVGPDDRDLPIEEQKQVSVARCARVSYLTHVGTRDIEADKVLHQRLLDAGHWSPFEHVALAMPDATRFNNFAGWQAYRHQMEQARTLVMGEVAPA
ncbi:FAD-dependent thymidylate synthase [Luteitalea sp.]|uniref:FAD-dependent thymidylate synthase n=1 Tax=Luteitalea sp. TaxID=2004800 RepID=UPI0037C73739